MKAAVGYPYTVANFVAEVPSFSVNSMEIFANTACAEPVESAHSSADLVGVANLRILFGVLSMFFPDSC